MRPKFDFWIQVWRSLGPLVLGFALAVGCTHDEPRPRGGSGGEAVSVNEPRGGTAQVGGGGASGEAAGGDSAGSHPVGTGSAVIGRTGGTLESKDGRVTLSVPEGALEGDIALSIELANTAPSGALGPAYEIEPSGTKFTIPALLAIEVDGNDERWRLSLATVSDGAWQELESAVVPGQKIAAPLRHLSTYGVVKRPKLGTCACNTDCFKEACGARGSVTHAETSGCECDLELGPNGSMYDSYWALDDAYAACADMPYARGYCTACKRKCVHTNGGYIRHASDDTCAVEYDGGNWRQGLRCVLDCTDLIEACKAPDDEEGAGGDSGTGGTGGASSTGGTGGAPEPSTGGSSSGGPAEGGAAGVSEVPSGKSYLSITMNSVNVTVDCSLLDIDASEVDSGLIGTDYSNIGGVSESTGQGFRLEIPLSAQRLRYSPILAQYPIAKWQGSVAPSTAFQLSLRYLDQAGKVWTSCAPGMCGLPKRTLANPNPDPDHWHHLDSVVEESLSLPGYAAFQLTGSFHALLTDLHSNSLAEGSWSVHVIVPDPGPLDCFSGCVPAGSSSCDIGNGAASCGTNGDICQNCTQVSGHVCVANTCVECVPGTQRSQPCNDDCGTESFICDENGVYVSQGCSSGPRSVCTGQCCPACPGGICVSCVVGTDGYEVLQCLPSDTDIPANCQDGKYICW